MGPYSAVFVKPEAVFLIGPGVDVMNQKIYLPQILRFYVGTQNKAMFAQKVTEPLASQANRQLLAEKW
jgi:hypothetical protein